MQSTRAISRLASRAAVPMRSGLRSHSTNISGGSMGKKWADREHAEEAHYFNKKDAEILARLASKLKNHTMPSADSIQQEKEALSAIFAHHSVTPSDALLDDIIKFKFNH